jgi:hypothetical protein
MLAVVVDATQPPAPEAISMSAEPRAYADRTADRRVPQLERLAENERTLTFRFLTRWNSSYPHVPTWELEDDESPSPAAFAALGFGAIRGTIVMTPPGMDAYVARQVTATAPASGPGALLAITRGKPRARDSPDTSVLPLGAPLVRTKARVLRVLPRTADTRLGLLVYVDGRKVALYAESSYQNRGGRVPVFGGDWWFDNGQRVYTARYSMVVLPRASAYVRAARRAVRGTRAPLGDIGPLWELIGAYVPGYGEERNSPPGGLLGR